MEFFMFLRQSDKRDLSDKQEISCFLIMFLYKSKVQCCKEQYCIGTWNVRCMNQGKLQVVKQEMARMNVDILEVSELKWTGMGEFNSDDHYIYCEKESLRRKGVAIMVKKKESEMQYLDAVSKMTE